MGADWWRSLTLRCLLFAVSCWDPGNILNARYLVEFASENKLDMVRSILLKHPDQVCSQFTATAINTEIMRLLSTYIPFSSHHFLSTPIQMSIDELVQ